MMDTLQLWNTFEAYKTAFGKEHIEGYSMIDELSWKRASTVSDDTQNELVLNGTLLHPTKSDQ
jgi:hypothetical protein